MSSIKTVYIVNHSHTDMGFTDYPECVQRQHCDIIDVALDVCERNAERPSDARFRWTCEIAWTTARWFEQATSNDIDRFKVLHDAGLLDVNVMPVNWTPLVSPALARRSLADVATLRRDFGLQMRTALQGDVNGLGWFWVDLLNAIGVDNLLMATNPHRGMPVSTMQRLFRWRAPSGNALLALHGWHYTAGANTFYIGDGDVDRTQAAFDNVLGALDQRGDFPVDATVVQLTNAAAPDSGYPTEAASAFVEQWNQEGRSPRLEIATLTQAMDAMAARAAVATVDECAGDWTDYWSDGVGSTAFETAVARAGERLLPVLDFLSAIDGDHDHTLADIAAGQLALYDEHTWGAFSSVTKPDSPFTRAQESCKTGFAHRGFAVAHEALALKARNLARRLTGVDVESDIRFRRGTSPPIPIEEQSYLVVNPTDEARVVRWGVPWDYGGAAPHRVLHAFLSNQYMPDMDAERTGLAKSDSHVIEVDLPPFGCAVVKPAEATIAEHESPLPNGIENEHFRLQIDPVTGALQSLFWKAEQKELVDAATPFGEFVYETLEDPEHGRKEIFGGHDFDGWRLDTFRWPAQKTRFARSLAERVTVGRGRWTPLGMEVDAILSWPGRQEIRVTYRLPPDEACVHVDAIVDKSPVETPEAAYALFGIPGDEPRFHLDVGEHLIDPVTEQLPHTSQGWCAVQRLAAVTTSATTLIVTTLDAPLVQVGGIQTENPQGRSSERPLLAFWLLNNHWDMNFAARQSGRIPMRFRLTPQRRFVPRDARRFAAAQSVPPVVVRAYDAEPTDPYRLIELDRPGNVEAGFRMSTDGLLMHALNKTDQPVAINVQIPNRPIKSWVRSDPLSSASEQRIAGRGGAAAVTLPPHGAQFLLLEIDE